MMDKQLNEFYEVLNEEDIESYKRIAEEVYALGISVKGLEQRISIMYLPIQRQRSIS